MANKQDVEFSLSANVSGVEKIKALREEVLALSKQGGAVGPEFKQLADELDRLGQEAASLDAIRALSEDIQKLSTEQEAAVASSAQLAAARDEAAARAREAAQAEAAAQQRLSEARKGVEDARAAIRSYTIAQKELIGGSEKYRQELIGLNERLSLNKKAVIDSRDALREAKDATAEAEKAESSAARAYSNSEKSIKAANTALQVRKETQEEALASLKKLGVEVDNLAAAEANLVDKTNQARLAQQLLTEQSAQWVEELKQQQIIQKTQAELEQRAALERKAILDDYAEAQRRAVAAQIAEEDRLLRLQERTLFEQREAAQRELQFELEAINRVEQERLVSAKRQADAQRTLQESFKTTGAVDVQALRDEIGRVNAALVTLQQSGNLTGAELQGAMRQANRRVKELELQIREATGALTVMDRVNQAFSTSFGQTFTAFVASNVFMRVIDSVLGIGRAFFDANKQLESFRRSLVAVYGSAEIAEQQLGVLRRIAAETGQSVSGLSDSYVRFSAALKGAGFSLEESNALFQGVVQAQSAYGRSTEDTSRALTAFAQIASKGKVSMEELSQQLGDSMPGALNTFARALQISERDLITLVESGSLLSRDALPSVAAELLKVKASTDTWAASVAQSNNIFTALVQQIGDSGGWRALIESLQFVNVLFRDTALVIGGFFETLRISGESIGAFIGTLVGGGSLDDALGAANERVLAGADRLNNYKTALGSTKQEAASTSFALSLLGKEAVNNGLEFAKRKDALEKDVKISSDAVKTTEAQAQALVSLSQTLGAEQDAKQASVTATQAIVAALDEEIESRKGLSLLYLSYIQQQQALTQAKIKEIEASDKSDKAKAQETKTLQDALTELQKELQLRQEAVAKLEAQRESALNAASAARIELEATKDKTSEIKKLVTAYEEEAEALEEIRRLRDEGRATDKDVADQTRAKNEALSELNTTYDKLIEKEKARAANRKADIDGALATSEVRMQELRAVESLGKSIGDENLVRYANVEMMRLQIETIKLKAEAQRIEAEAERQIIAIERQKIEATRELTETERIEFDTRRKLVDVKIKQAEASLKSTQAIQNEITSTLNGTQALNSNTQARQESNKTRAEEIKLLKEKAKYDEEGYALNTQGERVNMGVPTWMSIFNELKGYGLEEDRARAIAGQFTDANGNVPYFNNPGQKAYGAETLSLAIQRAAQKEMMNGGTKKIEPVDAPTQTSAEPAVSTSNQLAPAQNSTITMKFEIGGQSTSIPGLNSTQANALKGVIEQLATLKGTSV